VGGSLCFFGAETTLLLPSREIRPLADQLSLSLRRFPLVSTSASEGEGGGREFSRVQLAAGATDEKVKQRENRRATYIACDQVVECFERVSANRHRSRIQVLCAECRWRNERKRRAQRRSLTRQVHLGNPNSCSNSLALAGIIRKMMQVGLPGGIQDDTPRK